MFYTDSHIHVSAVSNYEVIQHEKMCICIHSQQELDLLLSIQRKLEKPIYFSVGIHPQNPDKELIPFLQALLDTQKNDLLLIAIGEAGFDFFSTEFMQTMEQQEYVWRWQLETAIKYNKPMVIHSRHALDRFFRDAFMLKKLPSIIFHSFPGSPLEAESFLKRGINAYFSFSKQILSNNKRALRCVSELSLSRILLETDAPFQKLKGEKDTKPQDIITIYKKTAILRDVSEETILENVSQNFTNAFLKFLPNNL